MSLAQDHTRLQPQANLTLPLSLPRWRRVKQAQLRACQSYMDEALEAAIRRERSGRVLDPETQERLDRIEADQFATLSALERCQSPAFWLRHQGTEACHLLALRAADVKAEGGQP